MKQNSYNLIDEEWIPIANRGKVSLRTIFSQADLPNLGGNPVEKISLLKLLLSIAQASYTPKDDADWERLDADGMSKACLEYLEKWHDAFYLYGEKPFLQMPAVEKASTVPFGAAMPDIATGNTSVLTEISVEKELDNSQKALLLLTLMSFALGGKKTDNTCILTRSYTGKSNEKGKASTSPSGSSLAYMGLLHNFYMGKNIQETLYFNLLTQEDILEEKVFASDLGKAPWEEMPEGEDCPRAKDLKNSLQGRLIALCRFCLLTESAMHYTEGLKHLDYKAGMIDPSGAGNLFEKTPKVLWVNPDKRPWRSLTSLLSFLSESKKTMDCLQLRLTLPRIKQKAEHIAIWSGGLSVSSNAGEQYVAGNNDYLESSIFIPIEFMDEESYLLFSSEMLELENISKILYSSVSKFYKELNLDKNQTKEIANKACLIFWDLAEKKADLMFDACEKKISLLPIRKEFVSCANKAFQSICQVETARQLEAFVVSEPNFSKYLHIQN